jgi:chemosensory pili system protein ChpA (sensor histidine kinase/response regulator)
MDRFSIDDVRESFAADMGAKIARIANAGAALVASGSLAVPAAPDPEEGIPGFDAVSHALHAIFGTSALVSARSMAESARLLEILADEGRASLAEIERQARLGRSLGEVCIEGARALERMLALELDHKSDEAWALALELRARMARWEEARDRIAGGDTPREFSFDDLDDVHDAPTGALSFPFATGPAPSDESMARAANTHAEFSFEDDAGDAVPPAAESRAGLPEFSFDDEPEPAGETLGGELLEVFRQEAREGVLHLEAELRRLFQDAHDRGALGALERIFHTLKGSAATVGLREVSAMATDLQATVQDTLDRELFAGPGLDEPSLRDLVTRTNSLLGAAGLPVLGPLSAPPAAAPEAPASPGPGPLEPAAGERHRVAIAVSVEIWEAFEEETADLLGSIERALLTLEESQQPQAVLADLFRSYHTLKGSMHTVGLGPLAEVVHRVEDFLEELSGSPILPPLRHVATLLLNVQDDVRRGLGAARSGYVETRLAEVEAEIAAVKMVGLRPADGGLGPPSSRRGVATTGGGPATTGAGSSGASPAASGPAASSPRRRYTDRLDPVDRRFVRVASDRLDGLMNLAGELVVGRSRLLRRVGRLRGMQRQLALRHARLGTAVERFRERHEFAIGAPAAATAAAGNGGAFGFSELEMDQYGDVNILARSLGTIADEVAAVQAEIQESLNLLADDAAAFGGIVSGLQGEVTRARMVPVEDLFTRLRLPVRDAAQRENKSVRVVTSGEDVDLDKTIVDRLYVPLLHVVRNAVAHGVETPEARAAAGKDPVGTVSLTARHESGLIGLEVRDDGGGLDLARLHEAGVRAGLFPADTPLDHPSVPEALFAAGVSTRAGADAVSGRGMGGDVIRREIEKLGGDVHVRTTPGQGTAFTITLPLTLAITRALVLRHRSQAFAVPLAFIERIVDLSEATVQESAGQRRLRLDAGYETLHPLHTLLGHGERERGPAAGAALIVKAGDRRLAIAVERVQGQEEIVVKGLGELLSGHPLLSGVTLSGDGELILILDVPGLLDPRSASTVAALDDETGGETGPPRVLFVDDSLSVRKVAEKFLTDLGAEPTLAVDGQEALDLLARSTFDLVFTDLEMPRLHGYELIQAMSASPGLREIPAVVVTSRSGQKHRDQAQAVGARDYLTKPFSQATLGQMLRKWVPRRARA